MAEEHSQGEGRGEEPEVRLELTNHGIRQVWALYSQERTDGEALQGDATYSVFLRDLPDLLWRGKWHLAGCLAAALSFAAFYLASTVPVYNVGALVLIEKRAMPLNENSRTFSGTNFLATQAEILQSPAIVARAVKALPRELVEDARSVGSGESLRMMVGSFEATRVVGTDVVALGLRTEDRELGISVMNAVVEAYREYLREFELAGHREAFELVRRSEAELRDQLDETRAQYQTLRSGGGSIGEGGDALSVQKAMLGRQAQMLVEAKIQRINLENKLSAMRNSQASGEGAVLDGARRLQEDLWRAEARAGELEQRYSSDHPELRAVQEQILALKAQLEQSQKAAPQAIERELAAARETERRLQALYDTEFERGKSLDTHRLKEEALLAEMDRVSRLHQEALSRLQERELVLKSIAEGDGGVVVNILDGPSGSDAPMWPQPVLVFLCAAIVGVGSGLGLTLVLDRARSRKRSEEPVRAPRPSRGAGYRPAATLEVSDPAPRHASVVDIARER
jgi:uncharacterized protein involved in exopolysaccharide biosynthesis